MDFKTLVLSKQDQIATLTLNRPQAYNAINRQMFEDLVEAMDVISKDSEMKVLVITGAGKAFSAGGDRTEHPLNNWGGNAQVVADILQKYYNGIIMKLFNLNVPTLAMVNGVAVGWGFDMSLACDMRMGCENTRFMVAFTRVGLTPAAGGAWMLPRVVGVSKAMEIILTAEFVEAQEAQRLGILNRLVPAADLEKETMAMARKLAANSPLGVRLTKMQLHKGLAMDLPAALELGATCQALCQTSDFTIKTFTSFGDKKA